MKKNEFDTLINLLLYFLEDTNICTLDDTIKKIEKLEKHVNTLTIYKNLSEQLILV